MTGISSCRTSRNGFMPLPSFDEEGHRGCRGLMPENTVLAMMKAVDLGVTTLEMDVVITADDQVVCSHEPFFNHEITTLPDGSALSEREERNRNIFRMTYAETKQYDVGLKPHPRFPRQEKVKAVKPLLSELIDDVEAYVQLRDKKKVFYNIETKTNPATDGIYHPAPQEFVERLMDVIEQKKIKGRTIIQSFDFRTLKIIHKDHPGIRISALIEQGDTKSVDEQIQELGFIPDIYSPHYSLVNEELVKTCRDKKMKLVVWTVNDAAEMTRFRKMGVDGIISDYPDLFNNKNRNKK
jgi:glycerophosphoryl diester phosphodiesterase